MSRDVDVMTISGRMLRAMLRVKLLKIVRAIITVSLYGAL